MKFIDFIMDAQTDLGLMADFMIIDDASELKRFFQANEYTGIQDDEIEKILKAKRLHYRMAAMGRTSY
jgi:hypothetical protein